MDAPQLLRDLFKTLHARHPGGYAPRVLKLAVGLALEGKRLDAFSGDDLIRCAYYLADRSRNDDCELLLEELRQREEGDLDRFFLEARIAPSNNPPLDSFLFGVNLAAFADSGAQARQDQAQALNAALLREAPGGQAVNIAFAGEAPIGPYPTEARLETCSQQLAPSPDGVRKPVASELFGALARLAKEKGKEAFLFANGDVLLTSVLLATLGELRRRGYRNVAITRTDVENFADREPPDWGMMHIGGSDAFLVDTEWWLDNERDFGPYLIGEMDWDTVYAGIMARRSPFYYLSHARGALLHQAHARRWSDKTVRAKHNGRLRDGPDIVPFLLHRAYYQETLAFSQRNRNLPTFADNLDLLALFGGSAPCP